MSETNSFCIPREGIVTMVAGFFAGLGIIAFFIALGLAMGMPHIFYGIPHQ